MTEASKGLMEALKAELEERLGQAVPSSVYPALYQPMQYALTGGGKRIRPLLLLLTGLSLGVEKELLFPWAIALEEIHTYSLIHDDLPAMDNDDYRRGRLTVHKAFGEAQAILAGDALLNLAFETASEAMLALADAGRGTAGARALRALSKASGGMVSGQSADLYFEDHEAGLDDLRYIEHYKTGELLTAPFTVAACLAELSESELSAFEKAGFALGSAFQIYDDILDVEGSFEELGKPIHSDEESGKATFVSCFGLEKARSEAVRLTEEALLGLAGLKGPEGRAVRELVQALITRKN